jgi:glycosyltransferase involved in cell wall biosynthesis
VLYPANGWPHKNHACLWPALQRLHHQGLPVDVVLTGAHLPFADAIARHHLADHVHLLGYCPAAELQFLYRHALALVVPSLYEGFGLPLLESMAADCPIVAASIPALVEVADTAALWFDPHDPLDLARAIAQVLTEPFLRQRLVQLGQERRQRFSPQAMVAAHRYAFGQARSRFQFARFCRQLLFDEPGHLVRVLGQRDPLHKLPGPNAG